MVKTIKSIAVVACGIFLISGLARADSIVFSNYGPGMTFDTNPNDAYFVTGSSFPATCPNSSPCVTSQVLAVQFTPSANYDFTSAQTPVFLEAGTNTFDAFIQQDLSGLPGSVISGFQVQGQMTGAPSVVSVGASQPGVTLLEGTANPALVSGTPYWLVLAAPTPDTKAAWAASLSDIATGVLACTSSGCALASTPSNFAYNASPNSTMPTWTWVPGSVTSDGTTIASFARPAFQVNGTPATPPSTVPEPPTAALSVLGFAAILVAAFRRRIVA